MRREVTIAICAVPQARWLGIGKKTLEEDRTIIYCGLATGQENGIARLQRQVRFVTSIICS